MEEDKRCHFQYDAVKGGTSVDFMLEYDAINDKMIISNIQLHSDYDSGLPHNAYVENNPTTHQKQLCAKYKNKKKNFEGDDKDVEIWEWLDSDLAKAIQERIFDMAEEQRPKFT
ncbi:hypothetical protein [Arachidicoccus soli]|uniref:Uncharacterized protein n=1 Tax=Arachidicoccus soli TaxID=2341117 RepID=A0A386HQQ7_9BACT|nr:hypothetical protein [Arachidicoccus soli]AYD48185.1 hypothetical protein D6B99_11615 [Arachidicoccus soli]